MFGGIDLWYLLLFFFETEKSYDAVPMVNVLGSLKTLKPFKLKVSTNLLIFYKSSGFKKDRADSRYC